MWGSQFNYSENQPKSTESCSSCKELKWDAMVPKVQLLPSHETHNMSAICTLKIQKWKWKLSLSACHVCNASACKNQLKLFTWILNFRNTTLYLKNVHLFNQRRPEFRNTFISTITTNWRLPNKFFHLIQCLVRWLPIYYSLQNNLTNKQHKLLVKYSLGGRPPLINKS